VLPRNTNRCAHEEATSRKRGSRLPSPRRSSNTPRFHPRLWARTHVPAARRAGTLRFAKSVAPCTTYSCRPISFEHHRRLTGRSSGRANGVPPGPGRQYGVHFRRPGPGVTPSSSPLAPTLGAGVIDILCNSPRRTLAVACQAQCLRTRTTNISVRPSRRRARGQCVSVACEALRRVAGKDCGGPSATRATGCRQRTSLLGSRSGLGPKPWRVKSVPVGRAAPNPSLKRSTNSMAHWPSSAGASPQFALAVQRATLLVPA
jgi:hypothetical protein